MATESQIAANRHNAEASTGPRTESGKSRTARNAITLGLYSAGDYVRPEDAELYQNFCASFHKSLRPEGALEQTLAAEIIHAAWRLRRCSAIEVEMKPIGDLRSDPSVHPISLDTQKTIDRARAESHRQMLRSSAELRRLQTDRQLRLECLNPRFDTSRLGGLASIKDMQNTLAARQRTNEGSAMAQIIRATAPPTKQTQTEQPEPAPIPRSAPCPCNSGQKYKRCCGQNAPAVLQAAA